MKIVITGGLGYIGTELCKIYSGESRYKDILVLDSRFVSERVKQLRDWGIRFIQCDLFDEDVISREIGDADIVIHLAGVTDVAYTKTESNSEKDLQITKVGVDGTRNILKYLRGESKILFPSTHVVYEGFDETKVDITEDVEPRPVLTYSRGKVQSEIDIINSGKNYIILRLASVYGYSTDTMRINIMPNLFSKIASQNGTIKLFSGGVQLKSLVPLIDVARCFKFMAENDIKNEIYHLSKESMTVKDVALMCKEFSPNLKIVETNDEIPNLGYTISNKKLLSTGFEFRYNLKDSIKEMITNWSEKENIDDLEYLKKGENEFIDGRGKISNYELSEPINLIGYIESKTGTVRANHYHPIQEQKCLLVKGKYISVIKDLSEKNAQIETRLVKEGDISVIRPNVAHAMVFLEDSIFLNLVRGERDHDKYGITHTIPHIIVDDKFRDQLIGGYKIECRSCGNIHLEKVVSLGKSPLANNLLSKAEECDMFPLEMDYCPSCYNCQLNYVVPSSKMFDEYLYVSSTTESFRNHFKKAALDYINRFKLNNESLVIDIGSNDGVFLKPLIELGIPSIGVEPAKNLAEMSNKNGIKTINSYFNKSTVDEILEKYGKASLITASNVFAHSDNLEEMAIESFRLLKDGGQLVIEVQYILDTIKDLTFDNIYHEHFNYWSVTSLYHFFRKNGLHLVDVEHIDTHGGSIRVFISRDNITSDSVSNFLNLEKEFGILNYQTYKDFGKRIYKVKSTISKNIKSLRQKYVKISAYGSPAKATTSLNFFGIDSSVIDYTVDDNPMKNGKFIPGVNIPIKNREFFMDNNPDLVIVLAWNFFDEIVKNNKDMVEKGVKFISIKDLQDENFRI